MKRLSIYCACLLAAPLALQAQSVEPKLAGRTVTVENIKVENTNQTMVVDLDLNMDSLKLPSNMRLVFTPIITNNTEEMPGFGGTRNFSTGILFLLRRGEYSHLHRLKQDEMWHFYLGAPLRLAIVRPDGTAEEILLGQDVLNGQYLQYTVPGGCWFGATPAEGSDFALVGCTVAPGFDFADFEMADPDVLGQTFPHAAGLVREFC